MVIVKELRKSARQQNVVKHRHNALYVSADVIMVQGLVSKNRAV